jgi:hypothetical protein
MCTNCGKDEAQGTAIKVCLCKAAMYCDADCQKQHWVIHRPDCNEEQGKEAKAAHIAASESAMLERVRLEASRPEVLAASAARAKKASTAKQAVDQEIESFRAGVWPPMGRDVGVAGVAVASALAVELGMSSKVQELYVVVPIRGIPRTDVQRIWLFEMPNSAYVAFTVDRVGTDAADQGHILTGAFIPQRLVIDESGENSSRGSEMVDWVAVPRPALPRSATPYKRWLAWLTAAHAENPLVTHGLYTKGSAARLGHKIMNMDMMGEKQSMVGP